MGNSCFRNYDDETTNNNIKNFNHPNGSGGSGVVISKQNPFNSNEFTSIVDPKLIQHNQELINAINLRKQQQNPILLSDHLQQQQMFELKSEEKGGNYIVLFDYEKATKDDITIRKNDYLFVIDKSHSDWWLAKNLRTLETGYVPFNYITSVDNLEIKEWFFPNCTRREAERLLEYLDNEPGMFLIRESEQDKGNSWSLSILDYNDQRERHTKHYKIRKMDNGGCYISPKKTFLSLDELVKYYSRNANGLCRSLTKSCPKVVNEAGVKDVWEEDRVNIELGPLVNIVFILNYRT
jgi:B lymphoid tyrosine kinase